MFPIKQSGILLAFAACFFAMDMPVFAQVTPGIEFVSKIAVPTFENVTIDDGTLKITGFSSPGTEIELLTGARQLGKAKTTPEGHFVIDVSLKLAPGQYQWVLRSTEASGYSATSLQTLVLTIPQKNEQRILAMLEEPGKPRRLMVDDNNPAAADNDIAEQTLLINYVSFNQGTLSVSGRSKSEVVFITVDNKRVAMSKVGEDGRFFVARSLLLLPGDHIVSINQIDENGDVTTTVREPFQVRADNGSSVLLQPLEPKKEPSEASSQTSENAPAHTVMVRPGDTLKKISLRVYGTDAHAKAIFDANRDKLSNIHRVRAGIVLVLPLVEK